MIAVYILYTNLNKYLLIFSLLFEGYILFSFGFYILYEYGKYGRLKAYQMQKKYTKHIGTFLGAF